MYFLYSFLLAAWIFVMLPFFAYNAIRNKKYLPNLMERTGKLPDSLKSDGRPTIWFHSCSVGETLSIQPLAHLIHERFPHARLVFSVITRTGRKIAEERFEKYGKGNAFYFPIDEPLFVNRVLDIIQPSILITVNTEIWPNVLHECNRRGIKIVMVNGRISAESFQYYRWVQPLLAPVLSNYTRLVMKSDEDADRIRQMGARASKISVSGNIKYDRNVVEKEVTESQRSAIDLSFGLIDSHDPVIVAGSTHEREEEILFNVLHRLRQSAGLEKTRLLIAPRHPERFESVANLGRKMGHVVVKRTENRPNSDASVLILDTLGELAAAYSFADVVFVGGTLIPHGGQSIMEPAVYAKPIVIGPSMENFPKIIDDFLERDAVLQISAKVDQPDLQSEQLIVAFTELLTDEPRRTKMGQRAHSLFEKSTGATAFTVEQIATALGGSLK